jgi:hypothetical protein
MKDEAIKTRGTWVWSAPVTIEDQRARIRDLEARHEAALRSLEIANDNTQTLLEEDRRQMRVVAIASVISALIWLGAGLRLLFGGP